MPNRISEGSFVYRAISELDVDAAWGTWLGEQRGAHGELRPVLLKHTGDSNRTRAGADALWLEALLTSKLEGPQVVPLVDYGVVDGRPFAVYDFEEGVFLAQVLEGLREREIQLPSAVAVGIILQACDLVGRLHELRLDEEEEAVGGFIHGSLCPRNFVLTGRGDVRVMGLVGVRPVGRVVGREHVPAAALEYASPDLLGGAPVTPAVDVYSLGAVLTELLGPDISPADELGRLVRELLASERVNRFSTVRALAAGLQEAVRRTGTVVARQSIAAQVRDICDQYLLERHKQVRALLETDWPDKRDGSEPASGTAAIQPIAAPVAIAVAPFTPDASLGVPSSMPAQSALLNEEEAGASEAVTQMAGEPAQVQAGGLAQYDENADDAVTRFMDDVEVGTEASGQAPAWMNDNAPAEGVGGGFSKWAVGGLMGVLLAIGAVAVIVAWSAPEAASQTELSPESRASGSVAALAAATGQADLVKTVSVDSLPAAQGGGPAAEPRPDSVAVNPAAAGQAQPKEKTEAVVAESPAADEAEQEASGGEADEVAEERMASKPRARKRSRSRQASKRKTRTKRKARPGSEYDPMSVELPDAPAASGPVAIALPETFEEIVRVMAAENDIEYEEAPKMAFLSVDASPYANVFIDGKKVGVTPIVSMELTPGPHRMVAKNADGETKRYTLMLEAGRTETVKITW